MTGVGVVAPCGVGPDDFWAGLDKDPERAIVRRVADFEPTGRGLTYGEARRLDRFAQFGVAAAVQAMNDAGLGGDGMSVPAERTAVVLGGGFGGGATWEHQVCVRRERGERAVSPLTVPLAMPNAAAAAVSMRWGLAGPCETIATACASGTHAIGTALRWIRSGVADLVVAGAAESCVIDTVIAAFHNMRALSRSGVSRPFDAKRDGFCLAEGAGVVILEEAEHALARGVRPYAEVAGFASTADAFHLTAPHPSGNGATRCMAGAVADAGLTPRDITHVNAHGTSTPLNDAAEAKAIESVFGAGPDRPAVTSVKGATGHPIGAAGAIEAVALALSYRHRMIPRTSGFTGTDLDLDLVLHARPWIPAPAVSNSFAFGGHNASLVFAPAGRDLA